MAEGEVSITGRPSGRPLMPIRKINDLANCSPHEAKGKDISLRDLFKYH